MAGTYGSDLRMRQKLGISIEKVKKIDIPLLVIGLGGTGADMVRTIKSLFAQRFVLPKDANGAEIPVPAHTAYLVIDSDPYEKKGLDLSEFVSIFISGIPAILNPIRREFNLQPYERTWVNRNLDSDNRGFGSGACRQVTRFLLSRHNLQVCEALLSALKRAVPEESDAIQGGPVEIAICAGISGGTGGGTFLDVPQIVRHLFDTDPMLIGKQYRITGYIVMPDVSLTVANDSSKEVLRRNAYAALKELDFWMQVGTHKTPFTAQYDAETKIAWTQAPYDRCVLLCGEDAQGKPFENPKDAVCRTAAESLLHFFAEEGAGFPAGSGNSKAFEDNLSAIRMGLAGGQSKPLFYGYRAIGGYTKRIPKRELFSYEAKLLFGTFLPPRDGEGHIVPGDALLKDGKVKERAAQIFGSPQQLYQSFADNDAPLPHECAARPDDKGRVAAMRATNPPPHDRWSGWREQVTAPAVNKAAEQYLNGAWDRFREMAKEIMTDPAIGPFGLFRFLQDPTGGLLVQTDAQAQDWENLATNYRREMDGKFRLCHEAWPDFVIPSIFGRRKAIERYLQALTGFYDHVRKAQFMAEMARQAKKLSQRIREWTEQALAPLCGDIETLDERFGEREPADARLASDVYDVSSASGRLDAAFRAGNADGRAIRDFLGLLCDASFETEEKLDRRMMGGPFAWRIRGMDRTLTALRDSLGALFGEINRESLDAIMLRQAGGQAAAQNAWMDDLAKSVLTGAVPLFAQGTERMDLAAQYRFLSVPDDAPAHMARFANTLSRMEVQPGNSALRDHLYCLTAWDGLPLFRYRYLEELRRAYHRAFASPNTSAGLHLVWDGDPDSGYETNWTRLPEPSPYYFFQAHGPAMEEKRHKEAEEIVARGIASGVIEVDDSGPAVSLRVRRFYADAEGKTLKTSEEIMKDANTICPETDPETGEPIQDETRLERALAFADGVDDTTLSSGVRPACLAAAYGLFGESLDPFDPMIRANPALLAGAKKNHRFLCEKMATVLIEQRPQLLQDVAKQAEGYEYACAMTRKHGR